MRVVGIPREALGLRGAYAMLAARVGIKGLIEKNWHVKNLILIYVEISMGAQHIL
ncbi:hypothetical protein R50072_23680 [Simiduia litorea]